MARYIRAQRDKYRSTAQPLSQAQTARLSAYFDVSLLAGLRICSLDHGRIETPEFYAWLRTIGVSGLPDPAFVDAITFVDTVVAHRAVTDGLLFHELVHVEQYRQLGVDAFAESYVRGFLRSGAYALIPLECNAFELGERFENAGEPPFSVARAVAEWVERRRF